jgi:hypothetical protein
VLHFSAFPIVRLSLDRTEQSARRATRRALLRYSLAEKLPSKNGKSPKFSDHGKMVYVKKAPLKCLKADTCAESSA